LSAGEIEAVNANPEIREVIPNFTVRVKQTVSINVAVIDEENAVCVRLLSALDVANRLQDIPNVNNRK
jgi:hypothetical protein